MATKKLLFVRYAQLEVEYEVDEAKLARFKELNDMGTRLTDQALATERSVLWSELYDAGFHAMFTPKGNERKGITIDPVTSEVWEVVDDETTEVEPLISVDH